MDFKVGILMPTRGDRPEFLDNALRLINRQTFKAAHIEIVDDSPASGQRDITWRYRTGYDRLRNKGLDLIAFWEDDDWYHQDYLSYWVNQWHEKGQPQLFGGCFTYYYHIKLMRYFKFEHYQRCSAMGTFIKPDQTFKWCPDGEPYTDIHLWNASGLIGQIINPPIYNIGIKHNSNCVHGGRMHNDRLHRYITPDDGFLQKMVDPVSYKFYMNYAAGLPPLALSEEEGRMTE